MAQNKQHRKELIEIEARLSELDRAQPYLNSGFYYERVSQLLTQKAKIEKKVESGELAPDIQFIIVENEG